MKRSMLMLLIVCLPAGRLLGGGIPLGSITVYENETPPSSIPYLPTRYDTEKDMLWMAGVGTNDVVYDLGLDRGRVAIAAVRDFHARRGVAIELTPELLAQSQSNAFKACLARQVQFFEGDPLTNDFSPASVVCLGVGSEVNLELRPQLVRSLKPGARLISSFDGMGEWPPTRLLEMPTLALGMFSQGYNEFRTNPEVPDFDGVGSPRTNGTMSEWIIPAPVAGVWRGKVHLDSGDGELQLTLHQELSRVAGSFKMTGPTNVSGGMESELWGDQLRFQYFSINSVNSNYHGEYGGLFDGRVTNNVMTGHLSFGKPFPGAQIVEWAGHRDKADFTGTWEWPGASGSAVQLKIERRDGRLFATYFDANRPHFGGTANAPIPVKDLYDFGGGFYFTLLLGLGPQGERRTGPEDGWLIGEAVAEEEGLRGTIAFYPYHDQGMMPHGQPQPVWKSEQKDWQPRKIAP